MEQALATYEDVVVGSGAKRRMAAKKLAEPG